MSAPRKRGAKKRAGQVGVGQGVGGGRPTKLTPDVEKKILEAIRAGNYMEVAAAYAGITKDTFYLWLKRGARAKSATVYKKFSDGVEKALADAEVRDVALIGQAAAKNWQAAAWRLERKHFKRWGRKEKLELGGSAEGAPIRHSHSGQIRVKLIRPASREG